jgi:hypothetical protein
VVGADTWAGATWDANPWTPVSAASEGASSEGTATLDPAPWNSDAWPKESAERGAWEHQPDPAAVGSGFYVDWGTPDTDTPYRWDSRPSTPAPSDEVVEDAIEDAIDDIPAGATDTVDPTPYAELFAAEGAGQDTIDAGPGEVLETVDPTPYAELLDRTSTELVEDADADAAPPSFDQSYDADFDAPFESFEPPSASPFGTFDVAAPAPADELGAATDEVTDSSSIASYFGPFDEIEPFELPLPEATFSPVDEGALDAFDVLGADLPLTELPLGELAPISWHVEEDAADDSEPELAPADDLVAAPQTVAATLTEWITAGADWQLGNAVPLVEVRNKGALVMRRADERWALADVTTTTDFEVEVEVDFRSGPGLGVLFRASVDGEGRMSGYSFDIDPIYDGGGYLVRQWHADRELWNPIARVAGGDPSSMYGPLTVRLALRGEELQATVNGEEVLIVDDLRAASAERGRDAAVGDRVGVQAWSSSDLVIDALRVAAR